MTQLTEGELARGVRALCRRDAHLARVVERFGPPPLWAREPGFATLVQIILEQQVSLASARAALGRLALASGGVTAERLAAASDGTFVGAGLTRQKTAYIRALARAIEEGSLDLGRVGTLADAEAHRELVKLKGIGAWSADIYLLMALGRPDVWPSHDLALAVAMREVKRLRSVPGPERQIAISERWRPWRAVAARILWHHYLSRTRPRAREGSAARRYRPSVTSTVRSAPSR